MRTSVLELARAIARAAVGQPTVRATLLALSILLGLGGCATSHGPEGDAGVEPDAFVVGPPRADAGPGTPDGGGGIDLDRDGDGYFASVDCNDDDPTIHPDAIEFSCGLDGIDQNCDGWDLGEACERDPDCLMWLCNG